MDKMEQESRKCSKKTKISKITLEHNSIWFDDKQILRLWSRSKRSHSKIQKLVSPKYVCATPQHRKPYVLLACSLLAKRKE